MRTSTLLTTALLAGLACACTLPAQKGRYLAYTNARIVTAPGKVIEKGTLLIKDGRIEAVGKEVDLPWPVEVVDCRGKWIYPGFLCIATKHGLQGRPSPKFKPSTSLNPKDGAWKLYRSQGFTTIGLVPRGTGMAGEVTVIRPVGKTREAMTLIKCAGASLGARMDGNSALAVQKVIAAGKKEAEARKKAAEERKKAEEARKKAEAKKKAEAAKKKGGKPAPKPAPAPKPKPKPKSYPDPKPKPTPKPTPKPAPAKNPAKASPKKSQPKERKVPSYITLAADVFEGKVPAFVEIYGPTGLLYLKEKLGDLRFPMLLLADDTGRSRNMPPVSILADRIKALKAAVVLPAAMARNPFREPLLHPIVDLQEKGIEVIIQPGRSNSLRDFRLRMASLVRYGLAEKDALAAITTRPAKWLGVKERIGTLEPGKDANFVLFTGKYLDLKTRLECVVIEGEKVHEREED